MKIEIQQEELFQVIARMVPVADRRSSPALACVLIAASDGDATFTATDMMLTITESIACDVTSVGSVAIPVHHLRNVVQTLAGAVTIEALDNSWVRVKAGRSEFKLMGQSSADFPDVPNVPDLGKCEAGPIATLIEKTLFSVSTDEARVNLSGALLMLDKRKATMVSTDGHRLTKCSAEIQHAIEYWPSGGEVIPRKGLAELVKVAKRGDSIEVGLEGVHMFARSGNTTLVIRLARMTFPPWQQVVPKDYTRTMTVDRAELIEALSQAVVIAPEKTATVRFTFGGEDGDVIELHADNPELGAITIEVPADMKGEEMTAGFNGKYLRDALTVMTDERVKVCFNDELSPCVIKCIDDDAFQAVVMPMRI